MSSTQKEREILRTSLYQDACLGIGCSKEDARIAAARYNNDMKKINKEKGQDKRSNKVFLLLLLLNTVIVGYDIFSIHLFN